MSEVITCGSGIDAKQVVNTLLAKVNSAQNVYDGCVGIRVVQYAYEDCLPLLCDGYEDFWINLGRAFAPGPDLKPVLRIVLADGATAPTYLEIEDFTGCGTSLELERAWAFPFVETTGGEVALLLFDISTR